MKKIVSTKIKNKNFKLKKKKLSLRKWPVLLIGLDGSKIG